MTEPLISIVMPVYNGDAFLSQAINGCLTQTWKEFELIIVDDCSIDNSLNIAEAFARSDPRVKVLRHFENRKLPAALNTGFAAAEGEFLTWTSHDNLYAENAIERLLVELESHPEAGVVYSDFYSIDESGSVIGEVNLRAPDQLVYSNVVGASFLYRREVYERVGIYDEEMFLSEDYDFWLRAYQCFEFMHISEKLYFYRNHDASLTTRQIDQVYIATEKALSKYVIDNKTLDRDMIHKIEYNMMRLSYVYRRYDKTVGYFIKCLKSSPLTTLHHLLANRHDLISLLDSFSKSRGTA